MMRARVWAAGLALVATVAAGAAGAAENGAGRVIAVSGYGEVTARPDQAIVRAGVVSRAEGAAEALDDNSAAMTRVVDGLAAFDIAADDIRTANFSISPQWSRTRQEPPEPPRILGYQVVNQIVVRVRALPRLGGLLDRLVRLGANSLGGIQFIVSDAEKRRDEARRAAIRDARRKAALYAAAAGVSLGPVLSIREGAAPGPQPVFHARMEMAEAVPIAPGTETLSAHVAITCAIE